MPCCLSPHDYTWDVIIATVGGTMEFWIGAGLLSIVQIMIFSFDYVSDVDAVIMHMSVSSSGSKKNCWLTLVTSYGRSDSTRPNEHFGIRGENGN